jgi:hypothetical protein
MVEFLGELGSGVGVVLFVEVFDVAVDGGVDDVQGFGDVFVGKVLEEEVEDLFSAFGGGAAGVGGVAAFSGGGEPVGFGDFVAEEEAGGEVGDEGVPGVAVDAGEVARAVALGAGRTGPFDWLRTGPFDSLRSLRAGRMAALSGLMRVSAARTARHQARGGRFRV